MNEDAERAVHVFITGRVQGVWFRGWLAKQADQFDVKGWVRNRLDGRVEALFIGHDVLIQKMLELCRRGPPAARVDDLEVTEVEVPKMAVGFERRATA